MKNKEQIAKIWDVLDSLNADVLHNKQAIIKLENEREQPQLKQLDQSVFDGQDKKWRFAAVGKNGSVYKFRFTPKVFRDSYLCDEGYHKCSLVGEGYDTSNWQNSLIERESRELTGSDLVRAMLARGDKYVMCRTGDGVKVADVADSVRINTTDGCRYRWVTPTNNQGEPLTQAEAGL